MEFLAVAISLFLDMLPVLEAILHLLVRIQEQIDLDPVMGQLPAIAARISAAIVRSSGSSTT